jgi:type IV secretion system T-DNA border endonuclease VirD2
MGEDWAIVEAGRPRRGRSPGLGLRAAHAADVKRGLAGGILPGRKPQAVVKMVRKGGASDIRGLRAQIAYLSRDGAQPLERSEALGGVEIDAEQLASIEKGWRMPPEGSGRADRTSHFIVSFPEDADHASAQRAGRAWAEEMFGSGNHGGDRYDYYTAFHTDRAHPHMHVVVHRRGLDDGAWLKVSQRSDMNYDRMREVLVDVAGREGIELEATSRLARGLHDRPIPDAEYRLALDEGRAGVPPDHTHETAIRAAASLIHFSRQFAADALAIERDLPDQAAMLRSISETLAEGRAITIQSYENLSTEEEKKMADRLEEVSGEVRGKLQRLDGDVMDVDDNAMRMKLLRQIAQLKETTVPYMREPGELRAFAERDDSGRFESFPANDPVSEQVKSVADEVARDVARDYGVDEGATIERYSGPPPSRGLARQFIEAEERERGEFRARSGAGPESVEERQAALESMREELQNVYREGRTILETRRTEIAEGLEDRSFNDRDAEKLVRDGASREQRDRDVEQMSAKVGDVDDGRNNGGRNNGGRNNGGRDIVQADARREAQTDVERSVEARQVAGRTLTPEQERRLRELERDTDDYDR